MSTTNEQVVVEFFRAFDRLDLEAALGYLTEDCVHDDKPVGVHRGKEEIRKYFVPQMKELKSFRAELKETFVGRGSGDERAGGLDRVARGKESGVTGHGGVRDPGREDRGVARLL
jgi:hypothetical protein